MKSKIDLYLRLHRAGLRFQQDGKYSAAVKYFNRILDIPEAPGNSFHAAALYHLAQIAQSFEEKKKYLEQCLQKEANHRMARVLLACLTDDTEKRLAEDKDGLIKPFFEQYSLNVQIQTISTCNAKCVICPYHNSWQKKHPGYMTDEMFQHIMQMLKGIPLGKVCLYLENEPLLDKNIFRRIETVKNELNFKLIEISTNGRLLSDDNIEKLYNSLKDTSHMVWISWHGITPEVYKKLMGMDFEANLYKLKRYFSFTKGELCTSINSITGSKLDKNEQFASTDDTIEFFKQVIRSVGVNPEKESIKFKPFLYHNRADNLTSLEIKDSDTLKKIGKLKPYCWRIKEWLHFLYDGDLILCCMDYHKETVMGNVSNFDTLESLLASGLYLGMQKQALGHMKSSDEFICKRCISPGG